MNNFNNLTYEEKLALDEKKLTMAYGNVYTPTPCLFTAIISPLNLERMINYCENPYDYSNFYTRVREDGYRVVPLDDGILLAYNEIYNNKKLSMGTAIVVGGIPLNSPFILFKTDKLGNHIDITQDDVNRYIEK